MQNNEPNQKKERTAKIHPRGNPNNESEPRSTSTAEAAAVKFRMSGPMTYTSKSPKESMKK